MPEHGGYRAPSKKVKVSGPGKYSQRTDGVPSIDNPDIQYGDVQKLEEARKANPLPSGTSEQTFGSPGASQSVSGQSGGGAGGGLPSFLFDTPTNRPGEPITTGMDKRQPDPNDTKELVLAYLAQRYGNATAKKWLDEIRGVTPATMPTGGVPSGQIPVTGGDGGDGGNVPGAMPGGPLPDAPGAAVSGSTLDEPFSDELEPTDNLVEETAEEPILG